MTESEGGRRPPLGRTLLVRLAAVVIIVGAVLFFPAGTLRWWQAWVWIGVWLVPASVLVTRLLREDPELLERRLRIRERDPAQRLIIASAWVLFAGTFILCGLDRRWGWSEIPAAAVLAADALIGLGYLLFVRVLAENRFASRTIGVEDGQTVVTTGPYAVVRHPMYVAALLIYILSPVALGSYWGVLGSVSLIVPIVARIRNEEALCARALAGYRAYMEKTRYRLIPWLW